MKLLFDQGTAVPLRNDLSAHSVDTVAEKGWSQKDNGELLDLAERDGYEVFITTDQNLRYQQQIPDRQIGIVVLLSANWSQIRHRVVEIREAVETVQPGTVVEVPIRID